VMSPVPKSETEDSSPRRYIQVALPFEERTQIFAIHARDEVDTD
jgi:hypothetical protein